MAFEGIITNDAQKEDMAVSLAVLLIKDAGKEVTVSPGSRPSAGSELRSATSGAASLPSAGLIPGGTP